MESWLIPFFTPHFVALLVVRFKHFVRTCRIRILQTSAVIDAQTTNVDRVTKSYMAPKIVLEVYFPEVNSHDFAIRET